MLPPALHAEIRASLMPLPALRVTYELTDFYAWRSWYGDRVSLECLE